MIIVHLTKELIDLSGGDDEVHDALVSQVFTRFAEVIGVSDATGYDWINPNPVVIGPQTVRRVSQNTE